MKKAYIFPGQGAQFSGMGKDLYENSATARELFDKADEILGFKISKIMFEGTPEDLKQTKVTQPAVFLHSYAMAQCLESFDPQMVAGHSLGEFSALAAAGALNFEDALKLVSARAIAMQKACDETPSTMAAIIGLEDSVIEEVCSNCPGMVIPANYNCKGQVVISGETEAVNEACARLKEAGARRALILQVNGGFHSPLMEGARQELAKAISVTEFHAPICPVYQNVTALPTTDPEVIKSNLLEQLTSPVRWTQSVINMLEDGAEQFIELGPGNVLQGLVRKIAPKETIIEGHSSLK